LIYQLALANCDFIHYRLRLALTNKLMTTHTYHIAVRSLIAAGIIKTGVTTFGDMNADMEEHLREEEERYERTLSLVYETLESIPKEISRTDRNRDETQSEIEKKVEKIRQSLMALQLSPRQEITRTSVIGAPGSSEKIYIGSINGSDIPPAERKRILRWTVDEFQRFTSLCFDKKPQISSYAELVNDWYHVVSGAEQGYVILTTIHRKDEESAETFKKRLYEKVAELILKMRETIGNHPAFPRLSIHPASFGEIMPVGLVPEEETDVMTIDADGTAKDILNVMDLGNQLCMS